MVYVTTVPMTLFRAADVLNPRPPNKTALELLVRALSSAERARLYRAARVCTRRAWKHGGEATFTFNEVVYTTRAREVLPIIRKLENLIDQGRAVEEFAPQTALASLLSGARAVELAAEEMAKVQEGEEL